ncbi:MAG TPA: glycosyltransferase N-terminal domain-containing protein [Syntrophorhabdaceae bacterium]|nr:glycosyltransferase N-terminal domain-containing protein [Syntrophorhabdaceae bacterium]HQM82700.1 glycosyltransferase N-terminal domain-containing protein [Syntrophorhabdaceae bacterium]
MWKIIYNILTFVALPFFLLFALSKRKIRKNILERLVPPGTAGKHRMVWVHAASIGEALIAENLVNYMRENTGFQHFLITTNTHYAGELLEKRLGDHALVRSLPLDFIYSIRRLLRNFRPEALLIIETEIWPNLIWLTKKEGAPVMIVNGRISDATIKRYRGLSFFLRQVLADIDYVLAQSEEHRQRYISIGMSLQKVINTGNIKYYRKPAAAFDASQKERIITYGSVREKELDTVFYTIKRLKERFPDYSAYVAPRELHLTGTIEKELSSFFPCARYSSLKKAPHPISNTGAVVVDTVGDLIDIYKRSMVAFVGGSLAPYGGQNILEPLFFGTPVLFGPFMENFRDIADQVAESGAGIVVKDGDELVRHIAMILEDAALMKEMGEAGRRIIGKQQEVMRRTVDVIVEKIKLAHGS